jgi:hypothetical protein
LGGIRRRTGRSILQKPVLIIMLAAAAIRRTSPRVVADRS